MGRFARLHAWMTCQFAAFDVPAYGDFLHRGGWGIRWFGLAPTRPPKRSYVTAYPEEQRCWHGQLEIEGSVVDESSGSSGRPFNWVRGRRELRSVHKNLAGYTTMVFPSRRRFVINAYSMGAWATGTNTGIAMARIAMVKNTGPDLAKIADTLRHFGPGFDYIVTAYPPFLKHLRDRLDAEGFPWQEYRISGLVGGEGMTEALRDYLEERFLKVRSGYGASDLTIGMAGETDLSVWLRRRLRTDPALRAALLGERRAPAADGLPVQPAGDLPGDHRRQRRCSARSTPRPCSPRRCGTTSATRDGCAPSPRCWPRFPRPRGPRRSRPGRRDRMRCRCCSCSAAATARSPTWVPTSTRRTWSTASTTGQPDGPPAWRHLVGHAQLVGASEPRSDAIAI